MGQTIKKIFQVWLKIWVYGGVCAILAIISFLPLLAVLGYIFDPGNRHQVHAAHTGVLTPAHYSENVDAH